MPFFSALDNNNTLTVFNSSNPSVTSTISVTGVNGTLLGIDTRPSNGLVYGITDTNDVYTIDAATGVATFVSTLNIPFTGGTLSGFDFNPVADRLRLVGTNDQDFRINVDTGEVTIDGNLAFAPGDPNAAASPTITAAAYENAIANPTATELYNIDSALDILTEQDPPNDGTQVTVGPLGVDFGDIGGFDIVSPAQGVNMGFAASGSTLYSVDLDAGTTTSLGPIGSDDDDDGAGDTDLNLIGLTNIDDPRTPPVAAGTQFLALTTDNVLQTFDGGSPNAVTSTPVTGLDGDLLGIDVRPSNGLVYGITTNNSVYIINPNSGVATFISTLSVPFSGDAVSGFDFNPAADRLRLVSENNQNFRINVDTGEVIIDGDLAFGAEDSTNFGVDPTVTAVAYINAIADPTTTLLYDIDAELDSLLVQSPANDGTLFTVGSLGFDFDTLGGFDIVTAGEGNNAGFAVSNGILYSVDLDTGTSTSLGSVGDGSTNISGFTSLPAAANTQFTALAEDNTLVTFASGNTSVATTTTVTGVDGTLLGIDTRPANGLVYGVTDTNGVYTIDVTTGAATLVSTLDIPFNGDSVSGFDFNPAADRLRLVNDDDQNFRINVDTGEVILDGDLAFAAGDANFGADPNVTAAAYINAIADPTTTLLFDIDSDLDILTTQDPANDGILSTVGSLGIDFDEVGGFDIVSTSEDNNTAFAVSDSTLYSINLRTGQAVDLGAIAGAEDLNFLGLTATGIAGAPIVTDGTVGNDAITGTDGIDTIRGNDGNDTLSGLGGDDTILGGRGNDVIDGGAGDDTLRGLADADIITGGSGNDDILGNGGDDILRGNRGEDRLIGGKGNDRVNGGANDDLIRGAKGNDVLIGGSGRDRIFGGQGDDRLFGGVGRDTLRADGGNDRLDGGEANDIIRTGAGNDRVVLRAGDGTDTVFRFDAQGNDRFLLEDISFGQISLDIQGRNTAIVFGDETLAVVRNNTSLVAGDFNTITA
ncbi:MAG: DUF4394 domain-containing protein [Elainellaceae cyanobacterium]